ncbi:hypothetical protein GCM10020256_41550 [Streptomyces thermocoprophilus]
MKSPLLSLPGAVPAEGADEGVAAHYGDLFREQRALADGTGFVDLSHRGVVTVSGDDRLGWLHLLLTQHVSELPAGEATEALILSAHGHIEHALYLVDDGETVWAHVEPGTQDALIAYLESMKFFYRVEVADRTADFAVVHVPAGSIAEAPEGVVVRETPYGRDLFLPRADLESFAEKAARPPGSSPTRRCASNSTGPASASRPTIAPSRTSWAGSAAPSISRRAATAARRPSPASRTWASRRAAWSSCTSTAAKSTCRRRAPISVSPTRAPTAAGSAS